MVSYSGGHAAPHLTIFFLKTTLPPKPMPPPWGVPPT